MELPTNLGLKKSTFTQEPSVKKLPNWLNEKGFHKVINPQKIVRIDPPNYSLHVDKESGVINADSIVNYAIDQAELLLEIMHDNSFQIILGGDCSILIGTALALKQKGNYGLFFLDGHTDFITPELSETGGAAGMDLAIVTGHGHKKLTNILNLKNYIEEKHVFSVGNREYDKNYVKPILVSDINYFDLKSLRQNGLRNTSTEFLTMIEASKLDGFLIHFDVDVLDDNIMPAVDSRQPDGLSYSELSDVLTPLLASNYTIGIEISILDPDLDSSGKYTNEFITNFLKIIENAKASI